MIYVQNWRLAQIQLELPDSDMTINRVSGRTVLRIIPVELYAYAWKLRLSTRSKLQFKNRHYAPQMAVKTSQVQKDEYEKLLRPTTG